jgi:hypothetical protein
MPQMALTVADQWNHHEAPLHAEIDTVAVMRLGAERPQWLAQFELGEGAA